MTDGIETQMYREDQRFRTVISFSIPDSLLMECDHLPSEAEWFSISSYVRGVIERALRGPVTDTEAVEQGELMS